MNSVWGFGGVKFKWQTADGQWHEENTAKFYEHGAVNNSTGIGKIIYEPVTIRKTNINRKIVEKFLGYRVIIEIELLNIKPNDYQEFQELFTALHSWYFDPETLITGFVIYPRYTDSDSKCYGNMLLDSDISMEDLHRLEIGQKLKLKFVKSTLEIELLTELRDRTVDSYNLVDEGGDSILDENGDKILIQNF